MDAEYVRLRQFRAGDAKAQPRHYTIWAIEERKSRHLIGMINYHRRDLRGRDCSAAMSGRPSASEK